MFMTGLTAENCDRIIAITSWDRVSFANDLIIAPAENLVKSNIYRGFNYDPNLTQTRNL